MPQALLCMSHSPLLEHTNPPAEVKAAVEEAFEKARAFVKDFDPDLIINFGPDHYNGFFYDLMPPILHRLRSTGHRRLQLVGWTDQRSNHYLPGPGRICHLPGHRHRHQPQDGS